MKMLTILLALSLPVGCAAGLAVLRTVVEASARALNVLNQLQDHSEVHFQHNPDPELQAKVRDAMARARAEYDAAVQALNGAEDLERGDVARAFDGFRRAYEALVRLMAPLGVRAGGQGKLSAPRAGVLEVPEAGELLQ